MMFRNSNIFLKIKIPLWNPSPKGGFLYPHPKLGENITEQLFGRGTFRAPGITRRERNKSDFSNRRPPNYVR